MQFNTLAATLLAAAALGAPAVAQSDFIVPSGTLVTYDTANGPIVAPQVIIQTGGTLRAFGDLPLRIRAQNLVIDGTLDVSGFDAAPFVMINSANLPEPGARGGPGAGSGGTGSPLTAASSPQGGAGVGPLSAPRRAGVGGESGYSPDGLPQIVDLRRPGGGGGGALAADAPVFGNPYAFENVGLAAQRGMNGNPLAVGVLLFAARPKGGATGARAFLDLDPSNDFFGSKLLGSGQIIQGELSFPVAGSGGGAGGDAINGNVWPPPIFDAAADEKGGAGGGGGGLAIIEARLITLGSAGLLLSQGGRGSPGENTVGMDTVGGSGGGGSGGYLLLQAQRMDLRLAQMRALSALGGRGAWGKGSLYGGMNAGGNGGPGVIALHVPDPANDLLLPVGQGLEYVSAPRAEVLLPVAIP